MSEQTQTPRTDAFDKGQGIFYKYGNAVSFARALERALRTSEAEMERLKAISSAYDEEGNAMITQLRADLQAANERAEKAERALLIEREVSAGLGRVAKDKDDDRIYFRDKLSTLAADLKATGAAEYLKNDRDISTPADVVYRALTALQAKLEGKL